MHTDKLRQYYESGLDMSDWYDTAHRDIIIASRHLGRTPEHLAGLLALFSPRTSVTSSVRSTLHFVETGEFRKNIPRNVRASVLHFVDTGQIVGPKTRPFWLALLGHTDQLVLDTHMFRMVGVTERPYADLVRSLDIQLRDLFRSWRTTPSRGQAALWVGYLRSIRRKPSYLPLLEELYAPMIGDKP